MKRTSRAIKFFFVPLLILALVGQGTAWSYVWCIGEDGHAAVEQATVGGTCAAEAPAVGGGPEVREDHCGACLDLPAGFHLLQARSRSDLDPSLPVVSPPAAPLPSSLAVAVIIRNLTISQAPQPPPSPYHALAALRTVVLLN